jgi:hypothetical protein
VTPVQARGRLWHITVLSADGQRVIFRGATADEAELTAAAVVARAERPDAQIWIKPPMGRVYGWDELTEAAAPRRAVRR